MAFYTDADLLSMSKEAEAINDLLRATDKILNEEKKSEEKKHDKDDNVLYVDFAIAEEFKKLETTPMKMKEVLSLYHNWAERLFLIVMENRGHLKRGKLRDHVEKTLDLVATITRILPMNES